ncbi:MAG: hypothetical protein Q7T26_02630 [Dehalococcoidia bacterium]|nr:hypothetical protein [Dehalococcoidia bacterium]
MTPRSHEGQTAPRYKWESHGAIVVASTLSSANEHTRLLVCRHIHELIQEFTLHLKVQSTPLDEADLQLVRQLAAACTVGSLLDGDRFEGQLMEMRGKGRLLCGLVVLLDPGKYERVHFEGEANQQAIYGYSVDDGLCLLLNYDAPPVRHEVSHMLGVAAHCPNAACVMHYKCPRPGRFCDSCKMTLIDLWH